MNFCWSLDKLESDFDDNYVCTIRQLNHFDDVTRTEENNK